MSVNKDSQKAPTLRFKGFTDDWDQRKLGEVSDVYDGTHQTPNYQDNGVMFLSVENIKTLKSNKYISNDAFESEFKVRPERGDVLMTRIGSIGVANVVETDEKIAYYVSLALLKSKNLESYFLQASIHTPYVQAQIWKRTLHIAFPKKINKNEIGKVSINVPNFEEQQKVGTFLKQIDNTITLHQRKLDQLNQLKEALLQQMFPGKGETVPKLRFAGFEGDWEERKLSALFIKGGSGGTPKSTNKDFYEGNIPFLGISDITKSNGFINNTEKHISVDGLNNSAAWVVPRGSISLAMYASVGKVAVLNIDVATSQAFYNMVFDDDDLRDFVYQCLIKANELSEWNKLISTGTQANLNADKVKNFKLYLPQNHAEIKLISAFLKQFDTTIAIQQRKLDQLKNMKQVLLENMFI